MKYKVGDKVRIRKDLVPEERCGSAIFMQLMQEYLGEIATIVETGVGCGHDSYYLDIDDCFWLWGEGMLDPVEKETRYRMTISTDTNEVGL